jgi:hypothetical protein
MYAMYAIYAILAIGAVCVAFFTALFAAGALIGLGRLGRQALRAEGRAQDVTAAVAMPKPVVRPVGRPEAVKVETFGDTGGAYAPA